MLFFEHLFDEYYLTAFVILEPLLYNIKVLYSLFFRFHWLDYGYLLHPSNIRCKFIVPITLPFRLN